MPALTDMRNIGGEMERKLISIGIRTPEELRRTGAEQAYLRLKIAFPKVCTVHLYALEGAILDLPYNPAPPGADKGAKSFWDEPEGLKNVKKTRRVTIHSPRFAVKKRTQAYFLTMAFISSQCFSMSATRVNWVRHRSRLWPGRWVAK